MAPITMLVPATSIDAEANAKAKNTLPTPPHLSSLQVKGCPGTLTHLNSANFH
jgi:hypothetical protein